MKALNFLLAVAAAVFLQAALGNLSDTLARFVDLTLLPVVWYGLSGTQRSAMLVGCTVGLVHDAWFRLGVFGITGFKRTLLGWALGGLGGRFDLNHFTGRFAAGCLLSVADGILDMGLRRLMDLTVAPGWIEMLVRAGTTGLIAASGFALIERMRSGGDRGRLG